MPVPPLLLVPRSGATRVAGWASWGFLDLRVDADHSVALVTGVSDKYNIRYPVDSAWSNRHYLRHAREVSRGGGWYHVDTRLHELHRQVLRRRAVVPMQVVRDAVQQGWRAPGPDPMPVLGVSNTVDGTPEWCCWWVNNSLAWPGVLELIDEDGDPLDQLRADGWPVDVLADCRVVIVGAGSIGGFAADALAAYAVPAIDLIDYDRVQQRNLTRHLVTDRDLGRRKVDAIADYLTVRWPKLQVRQLPLDVVADADVVRPLLDDAALVLAAPDGIAARRAANHLAWRAALPVVLACVLDGGTIGEVLRLQPPAGCLLCHRAALIEAGIIDAEAMLDLPYGTGSRHLPMTSPGGDLRLVGEFAAKAAVATLLDQRGGYLAHRLPGDHAVIGLQPPADLPAPFDVSRAGEIRWGSVAPPRPYCPTCTTPP